MKILTMNNILKIPTLTALLSLLVACGGGGGGGSTEPDPVNNLVESNPEFLAKAEAVDFNQVRLYPGHIDPLGRLVPELDVSNLDSGDLITIDISFSVSGQLDDYSLAVQLVPSAIFSQLNQGNTIGDIVDPDNQQGEDFIELGGVYVDGIQTGIMHAVIHAKLPVLEQDTVYKVLITPSLGYLASGKDINNDDVNSVPIFFDDRELVVSKLEAVSAKIVQTADLLVDNEFTQLEIGADVDANGFMIEPLFQTAIEVDLTTFSESEEIVLSLFWISSGGSSFPLGLLSSDAAGNPVIDMQANFTVERTDATSVTIPVVAYVTSSVQALLLSEATHIQDVADQQAATGNFKLELAHVDNGVNVNSGQSYDISIPLVKQEDRSKAEEPTEVSGFTVLRAGITNSGCLANSSPDDINPDERSLVATNCSSSDSNDRLLWRYDLTTRQIISKNLASDGKAFCISGVDSQLFLLANGGTLFLDTDFDIRQCDVPLPSQPVTAGASSQQFIFEDKKIRLEGFALYLDVKFDDAFGNPLVTPEVVLTRDVTLAGDSTAVAAIDDFSKDANGADVDRFGRLFHVGKFYDRGWGNVDTARVNLSYGGDTQLDYIPVLGISTEGHVNLSASLFGGSIDLVELSFTHKRYLSKQISLLSGNTQPVKVENGAEIKMDVFGRTAKTFGEINSKTVTENYSPAQGVEEMLDIELSIEPAITIDTGTNLHYDLDEEFLDITFTVVVIPVHLKGGIQGLIDVTGKLTSTTEVLGIDAIVSEKLGLEGYLEAEVLKVVTITGKVIVIDQSLDFNANGHFALTTTLPPALSFDISSSLEAELNLLQGKLIASVKYPSPCWCAPPWKIKTKDKLLYSSPFLFEKKWTIFSAEGQFSDIDF